MKRKLVRIDYPVLQKGESGVIARDIHKRYGQRRKTITARNLLPMIGRTIGQRLNRGVVWSEYDC